MYCHSQIHAPSISVLTDRSDNLFNHLTTINIIYIISNIYIEANKRLNKLINMFQNGRRKKKESKGNNRGIVAK